MEYKRRHICVMCVSWSMMIDVCYVVFSLARINCTPQLSHWFPFNKKHPIWFSSILFSLFECSVIFSVTINICFCPLKNMQWYSLNGMWQMVDFFYIFVVMSHCLFPCLVPVSVNLIKSISISSQSKWLQTRVIVAS